MRRFMGQPFLAAAAFQAASSSVVLALLALTASAAPRTKVIKLAITNPTASARAAEDIVVPVAALKRIAPDISAGSVIVTTSNAATLDQDALTLAATELPSQ